MTATVSQLSTGRSLRQRVTTGTVLIAAAVLVVVEASTFLLYRQLLEEQLDETLDSRVALTEALAEDLSGRALTDRLETVGIRATITEPDGTTSRSTPSVPRVPRDLPAPGADPDPEDVATRTTTLADGSTAIVSVFRTGVDRSLRTLLAIEILATTAGLAVVIVVSRRAARRSLEPIDAVVEFVQAVGRGDRERRLDPDDQTTEIGQLAGAVDQMVQDLREGETELREQIEAGQRFLADAAHQLGTPIAGIRASVELVATHPDNPRKDELLANAMREGQRATRLIDRLLTLARFDQHRSVHDLQTVDLTALIDREIDRIWSIAPHVAANRTGGAPPLKADPGELSEALANLLDNARQNAVTRIDVTIESDEHNVHVAVEEDGPTMDTAEARRALERFHTTRPGGTGLGLPIAVAVIEAHGGTLEYRDGAVHVRLPRR